MWKFIFAVFLLLSYPLPSIAADFSEEYAACVEKAAGETQSLLDCDASETVRQDARLNKVYHDLMRILPENRKNLLREAQKAWLVFRDAECAYKLNIDEGEASQLNASGCILTATAERVESLEFDLLLMPSQE